MSKSPVYKYGGLSSDRRHYIEGPGNGFGYHAGTLWPEFQFESQELAEKVAKMVEEAYHEGAADARGKMRRSLGLNV